jgi:hypothetical protein
MVISEEDIWNGNRIIFFMACGTCGTRGPWGDTEEEAENKWNERDHRNPEPAPEIIAPALHGENQ